MLVLVTADLQQNPVMKSILTIILPPCKIINNIYYHNNDEYKGFSSDSSLSISLYAVFIPGVDFGVSKRKSITLISKHFFSLTQIFSNVTVYSTFDIFPISPRSKQYAKRFNKTKILRSIQTVLNRIIFCMIPIYHFFSACFMRFMKVSSNVT